MIKGHELRDVLRSEAEALQPARPSVPLAQPSEALLCLEPLCLPLSLLLPARQGPLEPLPPLPRPLGYCCSKLGGCKAEPPWALKAAV